MSWDQQESVKVKLDSSYGQEFTIDLRINTPESLSYGFKDVSSNQALVKLAKAKGLDLIAITNFYTGKTVDEIKAEAKKQNLGFIPGVSLRIAIPVCNDITLTVLFPESFTGAQISKFLSALDVPSRFANSRDYIVNCSLKDLLTLINQSGGIAYPSKIDTTPSRKAAIPYLLSAGFRAFDIEHYAETKSLFNLNYPNLKLLLFSFSNSKFLAQVGNRSTVVGLKSPDFAGVKELFNSYK